MPEFSALPAAFYRRDVTDVARELLGKTLVSTLGGATVSARIFETEAYREDERGAHCFGGKRTARTEVMFQAGGVAYVFFVYGMHWQFNVVTGRADKGQAVLIRGALPLGPEDSLALVKRRRGWVPGKRAPTRKVLADRRRWCDGPAKLCQALAITGKVGGTSLLGDGPVWIEDGPAVDDARVTVGPRVGIDYAGDDALLPWRFIALPSDPPT